MEFFAGFGAEQLLVMFVGAVISVVQGFYPSISILEWLKSKLGVEDTAMELIATAFFFVLAAIASWISGELGEVQWSLQWLLANFAVFKSLAKVAYEMLKERQAAQ